MGCLLAAPVSVGIRSSGLHFSQRKVGISFAEVNGKQRKNTSCETHICLFCQRRSLWFAVWEISSVVALCDTYSTPTLWLLCSWSCADPLSFAAFPSQLLHGVMARAHRRVEDLFSAELDARRCGPVSPAKLGPAGPPDRKPTLEQVYPEGLQLLGTHELWFSPLSLSGGGVREQLGGHLAAGWTRSAPHDRL